MREGQRVREKKVGGGRVAMRKGGYKGNGQTPSSGF